MSNLKLLEPILFDNKFKIFDIKYNPAIANQLALIDFKGRLRILESNDNVLSVVKNYKISEESIYSLNFSDDGDSKYVNLLTKK
jgi:hypothetical protein